jgi:hypothetical protein
LNTVKEIITHNPKCLKDYLDKLLPMLIDQTKNEEEQIRNIVAESLGRLFVVYSNEMQDVIKSSFNSKNHVERATVVKSFKYGASKDTDSLALEMILIDLVGMIQDKDLNVKKSAFEALNAITHN